MRKEIYRMDGAEALSLFNRAPQMHLATTSAEGRPLLKTFHGVLVEGYIAFHAAPAGEKMEGLGQEAVLTVEEVVAEIPSYFLDPERACPATTYYLSAQTRGQLTSIDDPTIKAAALTALMTKYQPEGGHVPISADHPLYKKAIEGLLVAGIRPERLDGKAKLGQNRKPEERRKVLEKLWQRGRPGDTQAIETVLSHADDEIRPDFLKGPADTWLVCDGADRYADEAAALLEGAYWLPGDTRDAIAEAQRGASVWVGARTRQGELVATARALSDGRQRAWIFDVLVAPSMRGKGLGKAVMTLLLDHPALRHVAVTALRTRDAQRFYEELGFVRHAELRSTNGDWTSSELVRRVPR